MDSPTRVASVAVACVAVVWALVSLARSENREDLAADLPGTMAVLAPDREHR
ncbi:MAG: hypothetical protein JJE46_10420 [Acidimicrobiia bacterium]|nr:hypothetical protein [Acidimicrobiia bacterium]